MPHPGKAWYHIVFNTYGSWLTGDPRGFRSRNHRKHSDGDYKRPPPIGQHSGLHRVVRERTGKPVTLPSTCLERIGQAVIAKCDTQGHRVLAIAVGPHHAHVLVELPDDRRELKRLVGSWKQRASHAVREVLPGTVWSKSCDAIRIQDRAHHEQVFHYVLAHGREGAWVWSYRDGGW